MTRFLIIVVLFVSLVGLLPAAPVPSDAKKQPLYFPIKTGTKWVYDETCQGIPRKGYAEVVTESKEKNGRHLVTVKSTSVDFKDTDATTISQYEVSQDGVFLIAEELESETNKRELSPPRCRLKLPHRIGEKWGGNPKENELPYVAGKIETVKVPTGTFEAIRVDRGTKYSFWYAPGVGRIKSILNEIQREMKSFTLPKD